MKNYDSNNNITKTSLEFELKVVSRDQSELPEYYFSDLDGNNLGNTVKGEFGCTTKEEKTYRITFINVADEETIRNIEVITTTNQKQ